MTQEEINQVLKLHQMWLNNEDGGKRADLAGADLYDADLTNANLTGAYVYLGNRKVFMPKKPVDNLNLF